MNLETTIEQKIKKLTTSKIPFENFEQQIMVYFRPVAKRFLDKLVSIPRTTLTEICTLPRAVDRLLRLYERCLTSQCIDGESLEEIYLEYISAESEFGGGNVTHRPY